ncbi:replication-relaxation family protein [Streptomyces nigra]|uniref:replication-relaxation family protein n=1 Tax=Streptomyces nigra TaxID=1827580 RepID=UPI00381FAE81
MAGKNTRWPYGSTAALREDVLRVLGVLKVATGEQIQFLTRPHLTYRHRRDPGRRTKPHRNAALDLALHGLTVSEGSTRDGRKLWGLTTAGLQAAAQVLERPLHEMGSTARGAAMHGAAHAMTVNATVQALLRPKPDEDQAALLPAVDQVVLRTIPQGLGRLENMWTEVPLPITGSESSPGRGSAQADLVLCAPEHQLPLVFVEVDRGTMTPARVAQKIDR